MAKEDFINLFEIQSLNSAIYELNLSISDQNNRVTLLEKKKGNAQETLLHSQDKLSEIKKKLQFNENLLLTIENKITKNKEHLIEVNSKKQLNSLTDELKNLERSKDKTENLLFELLEKEESIIGEINDSQLFLKGIPVTIINIKKDVSQENQKYQKEILININRIKQLEENIEEKIITTYNKIFSKKSKKLVLGYTDGNKCNLCKFQISAQTVSAVETGRVVELCPECGCILAPFAAKYIT